MSRPYSESRLVEAIHNNGHTRLSFADQYGFSATHLSGMSAGSRIPTLQLAIRIAIALECRPGEIFDIFKIGDFNYTREAITEMVKP